jgi:hypothetical protein
MNKKDADEVKAEYNKEHAYELALEFLSRDELEYQLSLLDLVETVLARNIYGFEAAKNKASEVRKKYGLKFEQVKFKQDRSTQQKSYSTSPARRMDYAPRYNPSKRERFKGYYDAQGNFHDLS